VPFALGHSGSSFGRLQSFLLEDETPADEETAPDREEDPDDFVTRRLSGRAGCCRTG
jgi:hypothetical protein